MHGCVVVMRDDSVFRPRTSRSHAGRRCLARTYTTKWPARAGAREKLGGWSLARTRNPDDRAAESLNKLDRSLYDGRG